MLQLDSQLKKKLAIADFFRNVANQFEITQIQNLKQFNAPKPCWNSSINRIIPQLKSQKTLQTHSLN